MGLLLQLFVVTTLVAVLHSAPLDEHSESTTVGIKPLPATLNKKDDSKESDEDKADIKRVSRDIPLPPPTQTKDTLNAQSSTSKPQFGSRPARDTTHFISGVPSPQSNPKPHTNLQNPHGQQPQLGTPQNQAQRRPARDTTHFISGVPTPQSQSNPNPQTYQQNQQPQLGTPQNQEQRRPARDTTHFISGVPTPQSQSNPNPQTYQQNPQGQQSQLGTSQYPSSQTRPVRAAENPKVDHKPQPEHPPATGTRPVRDTNHPATNQAKVQTRPAPLPARNEQKPTSTSQKNEPRRVREAVSTSTSTEKSDN
ncbi:coiled-coil domain-containing protein 86 [Tribolium castaneum]|uniref:Uncharacterized protein n=1 Tax=Tribolium castaneum TaxID=7070 RepID=D6WHP2_TRICA|nr:PREDICTED: coiled-coil domain-containing protein 86 [Tribolium castaneum]EEZ99720.1 hypothetical protein TcasGA2_TC002483 [Tribolium castaneum]|eukprot:XP_976216.1 PREDICTED: coiled-coil domain-containing protein 86 [Tribolium castaneum]